VPTAREQCSAAFHPLQVGQAGGELLWNNHGAGALYLRPTRTRTRVAQKGRLLPHWAPFPFSGGSSPAKARDPLGLRFALKLALAPIALPPCRLLVLAQSHYLETPYDPRS